MPSTAVRFAFALVLCGSPLVGRCQYVEPPVVAARLASGRVVEMTLHRPVNTLEAAVRAGDAVIAATTDGRLLRFDGPNLRLAGERDAAAEVTCLGNGEGGTILAGLADGRVGRVDPETLEFTPIATLPKGPAWIGWSPAAGDGRGGVVVVAGRMVHDLAADRAIDTGNAAAIGLVDRQGRLWIGADRGELGGRVARVDLRAGTFIEIDPPRPLRPADDDPGSKPFWSGVCGFAELPDGQVWAYGGTMYIGSVDSFIARVDDRSARLLFTYSSVDFFNEPDAAVPPGPTMPVTQIIPEGDALLVLAYSGVFRVDPGLTTWEEAADLRIRYTWGRRDAVGAYPAVRAALPPARPGGGVVLATASDGLAEIDGSRVRSHVVSTRLGASGVRRIETTAEGLLFIEGDDGPAWKLAPEGWRVVDLAPPFEVDPNSDAPQFERDLKGWASTRVLVGPGGAISTVSDSGVSPGTVVTARREDGRAVILGRETAYVAAADVFMTPDGALWACSHGWLRRFLDGRWKRVVELAREEESRGGPSKPVAIPTDRPPWVVFSLFRWSEGLFHEDNSDLWRLDPGEGDAAPRFFHVPLHEGDADLIIHGATPWADGLVLLSTDAGLRTYTPSTGAHAKVDLPDPEALTGVLARDGLGRLWLGGGAGLRLAIPGAKAVESFADVPSIGKAEVLALAPDPDHPDGVIASLGPRGVVFIRAAKAP